MYLYIVEHSRTLLICKEPSKVLYTSIGGYKYINDPKGFI